MDANINDNGGDGQSVKKMLGMSKKNASVNLKYLVISQIKTEDVLVAKINKNTNRSIFGTLVFTLATYFTILTIIIASYFLIEERLLNMSQSLIILAMFALTSSFYMLIVFFDDKRRTKINKR